MPYALVTGAAKGIGRAISIELARRQYNLLLVDMDEENLEVTAQAILEVYPIQVYTKTLDLAIPGFLRSLQFWQHEITSNLEVVVNNAGFGINGSFEDLTIYEQLDLINVNVKAVVEISHAFLPILRKQKQGYLLNVCSTTAYQTVPYVTLYAASKAFVRSFSRGLRHELRGSNVSLTILSPGSTDTDFVYRARMGESIRNTAAKVNMTPEAVARIGVNALFARKAEVIPGFLNQVGAFLPRLVPMRWIEHVVGRIYEPKSIAKKTAESVASPAVITS